MIHLARELPGVDGMTPTEHGVRERQLELLWKRDDIRLCCRQKRNLRTREVEPTKYLTRCQACGRRHLLMVAEPGHYPMKGTSQ